MSNLTKSLTVFLDDECGQDIVEYAFIAALVALGAIAGIGRVANGVSLVFTTVGAKITSAV